MPNYICTTCGVQFGASEAPPDVCPICEDERQFVNWNGQEWTTLGELRHDYSNTVRPEGPGLTGIGTEPRFAIGQRALLVQSPAGNVLWDCVSLIDSATVDAVQHLGGISAIAISHPHYYSAMVEWSRAFGSVPIYLHESDRQWIMEHDPSIVLWSGDTHALAPGLTLVRCGGHFAGGTVLHRAERAGTLLTGDIIQVVPDRRWVSFMYSYPNLIPLPPETVSRMIGMVEPYPFEQLYGAWWGFNVLRDAKAAVRRSAERYLASMGASKWYSSSSTP